MALDVAKFRTDFPEFADASRYTPTMLNFWSGIGEKVISVDRFGDLYVSALELFTAHNAVFAAGNKTAAASGSLPGSANSIVQSKAVGSVHVAYENASAMELDAGHWNQTTYGRQYIRLARLIGQGCYQL
jgi:hypothetical protein